jgi:hypothetical protein
LTLSRLADGRPPSALDARFRRFYSRLLRPSFALLLRCGIHCLLLFSLVNSSLHAATAAHLAGTSKIQISLAVVQRAGERTIHL